MSHYLVRSRLLISTLTTMWCYNNVTLAATPLLYSDDSLKLAGEWAVPLSGTADRWLAVGERSGVQIQTRNGDRVAQWQRNAEYLDSRYVETSNATRMLYVSFDTSSGQVLLYSVDSGQSNLQTELVSATVDFPVEGLCLYQDYQQRLYLFLLSELYSAHQYLLLPNSEGQVAWTMTAVRTLPIPPNSENCVVEDQSDTLFISESDLAVWAYSANPETDPERRLVDLAAPFGNLGDGPLGITAVPGSLLVVSGDGPTLHTIRIADEYRHRSQEDLGIGSEAMQSAESITRALFDQQASLSLFDEEHEQFRSFLVSAPIGDGSATHLPEVIPSTETASMPQWGDAADDPALWVNSQDPQQSLILGTNKRQGLFVYDLEGRELQRLDTGRLNNVDVRYNAQWQGHEVDLAAASNRDLNTISLFAIDRTSRQVSLVSEIPTTLTNIYGLCLYQNREGNIHVFANDEDGTYSQYAITTESDAWHGTLLRQFKVDSQPEGCVANDRTDQLFVGEEDVGIWTIGAKADAGTTLVPVAKVGNELHDDVEGLALYHMNDHDFLIASSQGNDSYVLFNAEAPYESLGAFRIGMSILEDGAAIDGASETDGLEVSSTNLGGIYEEGILIVQDGRNVMPEEPQNFKLVPWSEIGRLLEKQF